MKPDEGTFGAMIDACVRNKDKRLAMETYGNAMRAGMVGSLHLHTGAIAACRGDKDMSTALRIFNDLQRRVPTLHRAVSFAACRSCVPNTRQIWKEALLLQARRSSGREAVRRLDLCDRLGKPAHCAGPARGPADWWGSPPQGTLTARLLLRKCWPGAGAGLMRCVD